MAEILCKRCHGSGDGDPASDRPVCSECGGSGFVPGCSLEGCDRVGDQACEMCGNLVCGKHAFVNIEAQMILCFSCDIGMREGVAMMKEG